jgi:hypothetical protein
MNQLQQHNDLSYEQLDVMMAKARQERADFLAQLVRRTTAAIRTRLSHLGETSYGAARTA